MPQSQIKGNIYPANKVKHTINVENDTKQYAKEVDPKEVVISVDDMEDMEFETSKALLHEIS